MSTEILMKLSMIIDKMEIKDELVNLYGKTDEEVGKQLISLLICRLYKAENEIYSFIATYKNISEEEAKKANIVEIIKEVIKIDGIKDFLS